jgi:hypothetical protein
VFRLLVHFVERLGDLFGGGSRRLQLAPGLLTKHGRLLCVVLVLGLLAQLGVRLLVFEILAGNPTPTARSVARVVG